MPSKRSAPESASKPSASGGFAALFAKRTPTAATEQPDAQLLQSTLAPDTDIVAKLSPLAVGKRLIARVVDRASGSLDSGSNRIIRILRAAGMETRADIACDQAVNACGYIAADVSVFMRDAALAEADAWASAALPDYSTLTCVHR